MWGSLEEEEEEGYRFLKSKRLYSSFLKIHMGILYIDNII
jgi:hypothetical protein